MLSICFCSSATAASFVASAFRQTHSDSLFNLNIQRIVELLDLKRFMSGTASRLFSLSTFLQRLLLERRLLRREVGEQQDEQQDTNSSELHGEACRAKQSSAWTLPIYLPHTHPPLSSGCTEEKYWKKPPDSLTSGAWRGASHLAPEHFTWRPRAAAEPGLWGRCRLLHNPSTALIKE